MGISQGDVWWADMPLPAGSGPGFRRPIVVVQGDVFNRSRIATVVCVSITTNLRLAGAPGNVMLGPDSTGLPEDSVVNVTQLSTLDRSRLIERTGRVLDFQLDLILSGVGHVLGRQFAQPANSG